MHYPYKKGNNLKEILSFLHSRGFSKKELENIESIWKAKYPGKNELDEISSIMSLIKNNKSKLNRFNLYNKLIEKAESSKSSFISSLLFSVGYGQIGNKGLLAEHFKKLISINEVVYINDLSQEFISESNKEKYFKLINDLFSNLRESLEDEKLIRILDSNFHFLDLEGKIIKFESNSFDWSLNEIRENMRTTLYGTSFPSFWMKAVINRISNKDKEKFISKIEKSRILKRLNILDYWIFKDNLSPDDKTRTQIVDSLSTAYGKSLTSDYVILDLLEDSIVKKNLSLKDSEFKKPIFTLKRNYFHRALLDGRETSFPIMKLIEMGEEREDFVWWLIL
ncbi:hypothetical protein [Halobacteriovorax sp. JY17]|uniref:hypothetical protein n=1 Tax=Halobacteriovorax sp. JY17 TaxID=2014617 RepID=UPI000C5A1219|nr:hypothetical protein [Halobacteriovorax sp. JY17]PIK16464.1 MAG: hypothetical protein CES88_06915 [Halobacteriovorax sp. JY17]